MFCLGSMFLVKELKTRPNIEENSVGRSVGRQGVALKGPTRSCHCASLKKTAETLQDDSTFYVNFAL